MTAPLQDVTVVAVEQAVAAPLATRHLADLGATVLKVERPEGGDFSRSYDTKVEGQSAFFVWANRAKHSVVIDLKAPMDHRLLHNLIAGADVFIQNLSPAAAERAGLSARQLTATHPRLIACDISGYGLGGPRTDDKAYDLAIQAEAGAISLTGSAEHMSKVGFSVADISSAMYAVSSILAALHRRDTTGEGAAIELSMLECVTEWTAGHIYAAAGTGVVPDRSGHRHTLIAPYGLFDLSDGSQVLIAVQAHHEWVALADSVLEAPDLVDDERFSTNEARIANVDELETLINSVFGRSAPEVVLGRLETARVAHSRVRDPLAVWNHEQLAARDRFMTVEIPTGETTMFRPPFNISDTPDPDARVPALGEHDPELIERLLQDGGALDRE